MHLYATSIASTPKALYTLWRQICAFLTDIWWYALFDWRNFTLSSISNLTEADLLLNQNITIMKSLICPVSREKLDENMVRFTGMFMALLTSVSIIFQWPEIMLIVVLDYYIRGFTQLNSSPMSWLAKSYARILRLRIKPINKAPKIFAARVGFLFALSGLALTLINSLLGQVVIGILCSFAILESVGNICMGCIVYTHLILKIYKTK